VATVLVTVPGTYNLVRLSGQSLVTVNLTTKLPFSGPVDQMVFGGEGGSLRLYVLSQGRVFAVDLGNFASSLVWNAQDGQAVESMFADQRDGVFVKLSSAVLHLSSTGDTLERWPVTLASSSFVVSRDTVTVAAPVDGTLLHRFDSKGDRVAAFGPLESDPHGRRLIRRQLNTGLVVLSADGKSYFVHRSSPTPQLKVFDRNGDLEAQMSLEGAGIDVACQPNRRALQDATAPSLFVAIPAAAWDFETAHLWITLSAKSGLGLVYEYDSKGRKLREYSLMENGRDDAIAGVMAIAVRSPRAFIATTDGIYEFEVPRSTGVLDIVAWGLSANASPGKSRSGVSLFGWRALAEEDPPYCEKVTISLPACLADCASAMPNIDCKAIAESSMPGGSQVKEHNGCPVGATACQTPERPNQWCSTCGPMTWHWCNANNQHFQTTMEKQQCAPLSDYEDLDGDGYSPMEGDCNDEDWYINPGADPNCGDPYGDQNCNGEYDGYEYPCTSPLILDVTGSGIRLTSWSEGVQFDLNNDGVREQLSWTVGGDHGSWLALDRNGNGRVDDGAELFGSTTEQGQGSGNGFAALAVFDETGRGGNGDGWITADDAIFSSLLLWTDRDHNGLSGQGELETLASTRVVGISLKAQIIHRRDRYGNLFRLRSRVTLDGGRSQRWMYDVFLLNHAPTRPGGFQGRGPLACSR
jgi:hypothetical protein